MPLNDLQDTDLSGWSRSGVFSGPLLNRRSIEEFMDTVSQQVMGILDTIHPGREIT
jgi:hypothetical protein